MLLNRFSEMKKQFQIAAEYIRNSKYTIAFTGAGISVESGIPSFRGKDGLWNKFNPKVLDINYFYSEPSVAWKLIKEIFYDFFGKAKPNPAHIALAELETKGILKSVITQNIDNLHQEAGCKNVIEFHGNSQRLICTKCNDITPVEKIDLSVIPPVCKKCKSILKPDFVFYGEGIQKNVFDKSFEETSKADVMIIIGTTGEVYPATLLPNEASKSGCKIIEINTIPSNYTSSITDVFLQGKAGEILPVLNRIIFQ